VSIVLLSSVGGPALAHAVMAASGQYASKLSRYRVYRSKESKSYLCVCAARDGRHALQVARQTFTLTRTAFAVKEGNA